MKRTIAFITDFGIADPYAGQMEAVTASLAPDAQLLHITHEIPPQQISIGAHVVAATVPLLPTGSVLVAVVDPGVGTGRRGLILRNANRWLVGPDNGLLTGVLGPTQVWNLNRPEYWKPTPSSTFHGRDVFAPVAAHLARYVRPDEMGCLICNAKNAPLATPQIDSGTIEGEILHVDHFGNLITNIPGHLTPPKSNTLVKIAGVRIKGVQRTYGDGHNPVALVGSWNLLEIAVPNRSAVDVLGIAVGTPISVCLTAN